MHLKQPSLGYKSSGQSLYILQISLSYLRSCVKSLLWGACGGEIELMSLGTVVNIAKVKSRCCEFLALAALLPTAWLRHPLHPLPVVTPEPERR